MHILYTTSVVLVHNQGGYYNSLILQALNLPSRATCVYTHIRQKTLETISPLFSWLTLPTRPTNKVYST